MEPFLPNAHYPDDYQRFIALVKRKFHIDLSSYKETQMKRRLTTLRERRGFATFHAYYEALLRSPQLADEFLNRMTINVSEFFRNKDRWDVLEREILPFILRASPSPRFWSAACSTGEEPYSLALLILKQGKSLPGSILASDIDEAALHRAKEGVYEEKALRVIDERLISRYFTKEGDRYRIGEKAREMVRFRKHDLLTDPYPSGFDFIICRNVMIYFTEEAKEGIIEKFSRSLKQGGFLFVGSTEQIFSPGKYGFEMVAPFIYRKG